MKIFKLNGLNRVFDSRRGAEGEKRSLGGTFSYIFPIEFTLVFIEIVVTAQN